MLDATFGFIFGIIIGAALAFTITHACMKNQHQQAVFNELVEKHDCKLVEVVEDGTRVAKGTCAMPGGQIIRSNAIWKE